MFWGWFVGYSVSMISHKNTFLSDFVSFQTILLLLYPQFENQLSFSHFKNNLECLVLGFYFAFNLFIYPWWISVINCNDLTSYKVWKNIEKSVIQYIYLFFNICFRKFIYSNQLCLKPFELSLHWHFWNPRQVFGKVEDILFAG